jgi:HlyD family secretion protein
MMSLPTFSDLRRRPAPSAARRRRGRHARLAAVAVAGAAGFANAAPTPAAERADAATEMMVTVVKAKNMCFADSLQVTGIVTPRSEILVRPERDGMISQVLVEAGETVTSGQALARLAPPEGQSGSTTTVQAPSAGLISSKSAVVGMPASPRGEPLFRIAANQEMELLTETPTKNLARIAPNQSAKVEIIGVGELNGKVRQISTAISQSTQLGQVRLFIGHDPRVRVGAFGRATIEIAKRCGPAIPFSAVLYGPGGAIVQTVRDARIETRNVVVGLLSAGQAEIREGLREGDTVVVRAGAFVRDGDRVRPAADSDPAPKK